MTIDLIPTAPRLLAMQPGGLLARANIADMTPRIQRFIDEFGAPSVRRVGGAALVRLDGPLMSDTGWMYEGFGCLTHGSVAATLDAITADKSVATAVLDLDCPGWGSNGSSDTLDAIARLVKAKRTIAWVHDSAYSGGVWMAVMCEEISATPTAGFGHIGSLIYSLDFTEMLAKAGIKAEAQCDPGRKADGYPGVPLSDESRAERQAMVDQHSTAFYAAVAKARGLTPEAVRGFNAACFTAKDALDRKLIDRIETPEQFLTRVAALPARTAPTVTGNPAPTSTPGNRKGHTMDLKDLSLSELKASRADLVAQIETEAKARFDQDAAKPATFDQLKAAFPGADDKVFIADSLEKKLSLEAARAAYSASLKDQITAATKRATDAEARASEADKKLKARGIEPLNPTNRGNSAETGTGAADAHPFLAKVNELRAKDAKLSHGAAMSLVARADPELHKQYISDTAEAMKSARKTA